MKEINYFASSSFENIGNAFIDIGSMYSIQQCIQDNNFNFNITQTSMSPRLNSSYSSPLKGLFKLFWRYSGDKLGMPFLERRISHLPVCKNFSVTNLINPDIFIVSGCVLTASFFKIYGDLLKKLKSRGTKIIFYGCGGNSYSKYEIEHTKNFLSQLNPDALISRDTLSFNNYGDYFDQAFDGIDCAFFVNYKRLKGSRINPSPYVVLTFDKPSNANIEKEIESELTAQYSIIKACHVPYPEKTIFPVNKRDLKTTLLSDNPDEYLLLYANASKIYADRVHACIVSLAFGTPCKLYLKTPRVDIFRKITSSNIMDEFVIQNDLEHWQKKQLEYLRQVLEE